MIGTVPGCASAVALLKKRFPNAIISTPEDFVAAIGGSLKCRQMLDSLLHLQNILITEWLEIVPGFSEITSASAIFG
jgi:hypothetical protein